MFQGVHKFVNRQAPPQQHNESSPLPAAVLHKRQSMAAELKMKAPSSKLPTNTQTKSDSQSTKGIENQSIKTSSSQDSDFKASDYPRGSVQKFPTSMAIPGFQNTVVDRKEQSHVVALRASDIDEEDEFGAGFPDSVFDEDSDETTGNLGTMGFTSFRTHIGPPTSAQREMDESKIYEAGDPHERPVYDLPQHPVRKHALGIIGNMSYIDNSDQGLSPEDEEFLTERIGDQHNDLVQHDSRIGTNLKTPRGPVPVKTNDRTGRFDPVPAGPLQALEMGNPLHATLFQSHGAQATSPWDVSHNDNQVSGVGKLGNANKAGSQQIRNVTPPFMDGSDFGDDEETRDASPTPRLARYTPSQNMGMARTRRRITSDTSELDYDAKALNSMNYKELHDQPFEEDPNRSEPLAGAALDQDNDNLEHKLQYFADKGNKEQHQFFYQMSLEEWETAGDWFVGQFSQIMNEMKDSRKSRREEVRKLEDELAERMKEVQDKQDGIEKALKKMKGEGQKILSDRT